MEKESGRPTSIRHGHAGRASRTSTYYTWTSMHQRCGNPKNPSWPYYGGRGIEVCERWKKFENFLADMGFRPEGMSLDRIDNNKGYGPDNCRWAGRRSQMRNTRACHKIAFNGQERTITEWSELTGIPRLTIHARLRRGWDVARVLGATEI